MGEKKSFGPEIGLYTLVALMIEFFEDLMDRYEWTMSPSRFYLAIKETIAWCREKQIWHFNQPAFLYVMEQCEARAKELEGTHDNEKRVMKMSVWEDRKPPIPGGFFSILQIFDWFFPILRMTESLMMEYFGNPSDTDGHEFTEYEAWNITMLAVDALYKDERFGERNAWGWPTAYPWVKFVRDEMYEWNQYLEPRAKPIPPGYEPPFSKP